MWEETEAVKERLAHCCNRMKEIEAKECRNEAMKEQVLGRLRRERNQLIEQIEKAEFLKDQ